MLNDMFELSVLLSDRNARDRDIIHIVATSAARFTGAEVAAYFRTTDGKLRLVFQSGADRETRSALLRLISEANLARDNVFVLPPDFALRHHFVIAPITNQYGLDDVLILGRGHGCFDQQSTLLLRNIAQKATAAFENKRQYRITEREIAVRKRAEEELRRISERYDLATEAQNIGIFDCDLVSGHTVWNEKNARIFGIPLEASHLYQSLDFLNLIHPDDRGRVEKSLKEAFRHHSGRVEYEFRIPRKKKTLVYVAVNAKITYSDNGTPLRIVGCVRDVTRAKKQDEQLRQSERRLRATHQNANIGISEIDADGYFIDMNDNMIAQTEYSREELVDMTFYDLGEGEYQDQERELYRNLVVGEMNAYTIERKIRRRNGGTHWSEVSVSAVRDDDGKFLFGVRVAQSINARKEAEEIQKLLLDELNHRVKNTMATIQSMARQTARFSTDQNDFIKKFESRLAGLAATHDLLTKSNWARTTLADLIKAELMPFHGEDTLRWIISGPMVSLNPTQSVAVGMIIHELATNAVKYGALSDHGGHLAVSWSISNIEGQQSIDLEWSENDGPEIACAPTKTGFGTKLLAHLTHTLNGSYMLDYLPSGIRARLHFPIE